MGPGQVGGEWASGCISGSHPWASLTGVSCPHRVHRGVEYVRQGKLTTALACYKQALQMDAKCIEGWIARGAAYVLVPAMRTHVLSRDASV